MTGPPDPCGPAPDLFDPAQVWLVVAVMDADAPELTAAHAALDPASIDSYADVHLPLHAAIDVLRRETYAALIAAQADHGDRWDQLDRTGQVVAVRAELAAQRRS